MKKSLVQFWNLYKTCVFVPFLTVDQVGVLYVPLGHKVLHLSCILLLIQTGDVLFNVCTKGRCLEAAKCLKTTWDLFTFLKSMISFSFLKRKMPFPWDFPAWSKQASWASVVFGFRVWFNFYFIWPASWSRCSQGFSWILPDRGDIRWAGRRCGGKSHIWMPPCIQSLFPGFYGVFWGFSPSGFCDKAEVIITDREDGARLAQIRTAPNPCREPHLILVPEMVHSHVVIHVQVIWIFPHPGQIAPDEVPVFVTGRQTGQNAFTAQQ